MGKACSKNKGGVKESKDAEAEAELARRKAEEEAKRKAEELAKRKAEEEARKKAEEEARLKAEEEERRKAEEEAKRLADEEARRKEEEERRRLEEEEEERRRREEEERLAEEERLRRLAEEEAAAKDLSEAEEKNKVRPCSDYRSPEVCDPCTLDEEALRELENSPCSPRRSPLGEPVAEYAAKMGCDLGDEHDPRQCPICYLLDLTDAPLLNC